MACMGLIQKSKIRGLSTSFYRDWTCMVQVCADEDAPLEERVKRAKALAWLGQEMILAANRINEDRPPRDVPTLVQEAFVK